MIKICSFLFSALLLFGSGALAQEASRQQDSLSSISRTITLYREAIKDDSFLDEGREYVGINRRIGGHAFFETNDWHPGDIVYKGRLYKNVPLMYDIALEEIVARHYRGFFKVKLFTDKIERFSIAGHDFVRIDEADREATSMEGGFYDLLYNGDSQVLVKRKKIVKDYIEQTERKVLYSQENFFYIHKDGKYYPVKKKRSVLRVLKDRKKEVRRFLKKNQIQFWKDPESAIVKMTEFYDQATNPK